MHFPKDLIYYLIKFIKYADLDDFLKGMGMSPDEIVRIKSIEYTRRSVHDIIPCTNTFTGEVKYMHFWTVDGFSHREGAPAAIYSTSTDFTDLQQHIYKAWWRNGEIHNSDGPAVIDSTGSYWYLNGLPHRDDGPAMIYSDGKKTWVKNGVSFYPIICV